MSVRWRSASPGVSRTHGTEAITGSFASARHPSSPIRPSPMSACRSRRAPRSKAESFAWTRASLWARPRPRSSSDEPLDAVGDVQRHPCREQVRRVEAEPEAIVGHAPRTAPPRRSGPTRRHRWCPPSARPGPARARSRPRRGGSSPRPSLVPSPAACGPPAPAWTTKRCTPSASQAWTVAIRSSRVRRSVVGSHEATFPTYDRCATHGVRPLAERPSRNRSICGSS